MKFIREKEQLPGGYSLFFAGGVDYVAICDEAAENIIIVDPGITALAIVEPFVVGRRVNYPHDESMPEYFVLDTASRKLSWFTDHASMQQYFNLRGMSADFKWSAPRAEARCWQASS